jgi:5-formyltetrahydrofolate cyclo-ligase
MIPAEKQILRARMKATLGAFPRHEAASERIRRLLRALPDWQTARVIYGFSPLASEPDWIGPEDSEEKIVAFPKVVADRMQYFVGGKMVAGVYRVQEPDAGCPAPPPDLILVPGLAFDPMGCRLGRGGGYFDRWLEGHPGVKSLGLCFSCQIVETIPMESHDARVDAILTEGGFMTQGSGGPDGICPG